MWKHKVLIFTMHVQKDFFYVEKCAIKEAISWRSHFNNMVIVNGTGLLSPRLRIAITFNCRIKDLFDPNMDHILSNITHEYLCWNWKRRNGSGCEILQRMWRWAVLCEQSMFAWERGGGNFVGVSSFTPTSTSITLTFTKCSTYWKCQTLNIGYLVFMKVASLADGDWRVWVWEDVASVPGGGFWGNILKRISRRYKFEKGFSDLKN